MAQPTTNRRWYNEVTSAPDGDFVVLADALAFYDDVAERGFADVEIKGRVLADCQKRLPGLMTYYFAHLQDVDGIHQWLEIQYTVALQKARKGFLEHYGKALSDSTAGKYAEADPDVIALRKLISQIAHRSRKLTAITKGLEIAHFQLSNLTKMVVAGIEDATI